MKYRKVMLYGAFAKKPPQPFYQHGHAERQCLYLKGCNGSGKSTIPSEMRKRDPQAYYVVVNKRKLLTVFPSFNTIALGKYDESNSLGIDALKDTEEIMKAVELSEHDDFIGYDLIFDGIIPATILETWIERLKPRKRKLVMGFLDTPLEVCLERISGRNDGKVLEDKLVKLVAEKYKRIMSHRERHKDLFNDVAAVILDKQTVEQQLVAYLNREFTVL